jgi:2-iminobutanoate/2-iminopropanoate deaminase
MKIEETDISKQARVVFTNIKAILKQAGLTTGYVVKTTVLLNTIADFKAVNDVYAEFFNAPYPARAAYEVAALPLGAGIEVEAIASTD